MKPSEKLNDLLGHGFTALCVMRDIDRENDDERAAADSAWHDLKAATAGGKSLAPKEQAALAPLIDEWRKLSALGTDEDDGRDLAAWYEEIAPLTEPLPTRQYVEAYLTDAKTRDVDF
jgi:hypothetical protein